MNKKICVDSAADMYLDEMSKPTCWELAANSSKEELNKVLKKEKNHKTCTDIISIELLKYKSSTKLKPKTFAF